jgi:two-component system cell cycle response regulator
LGLPAVWLAIAVLLAAQAELTPDGLAAIALLVAVVALRLVVPGMDVRARDRTNRDALLRAIAAHEPALEQHTHDVAALAREVAARLGLDPPACERVARAAELHDIGKLAIPGSILCKPGPLDPGEQAVMRRHAELGEAIVRRAPGLAQAAAIVRSSHERWDGGGYPDGLAGEAIPLAARIVAVCDAYSAMRQARPYGAVLDDAQARAELRRCAGTQFDPRVVEAFCAGR